MAEGTEQQAVVDMKDSKIVGIGIVVADVAKTARRYPDIFGVGPWLFYDHEATDVTHNGKPLGVDLPSNRGQETDECPVGIVTGEEAYFQSQDAFCAQVNGIGSDRQKILYLYEKD